VAFGLQFYGESERRIQIFFLLLLTFFSSKTICLEYSKQLFEIALCLNIFIYSSDHFELNVFPVIFF